MSYSYDRFLKPLTTTDRSLQIVDDNGVVNYTINPFSILDIMISNNLLKINLRSKRVISIPFSTINESKLSISRLQEHIEYLKNKVPGFIDKQIENYVEDKISTVDVNWGNGLNYNGGTVSVGGTLTNTLFLSGDYNDFIGVGFDNFSLTSSVFDVVSDFVSLDSTDSLQILADNDITISSNNQLTLTGDSSLISIGNEQGLVYHNDYSSGFIDRSLVDKEYVDKAIENIKKVALYRAKLSSKEIEWSGYGYLYNWYAVADARGLANPSGGTSLTNPNEWRVPSGEDWGTLVTFAGGGVVAGGKLKSTLNSDTFPFYGWLNNGGGTDDYNFSGIPGGFRESTGQFKGIGINGGWWSSTNVNIDEARVTIINTFGADLYINNSSFKKQGNSVRLVREATAGELLLYADGDTSDTSSLDPYTGNDGTVYVTVKIGTQIWLAQNLRETLYNQSSHTNVIFNSSLTGGDFSNSTWEAKGIAGEGTWTVYMYTNPNTNSSFLIKYNPDLIEQIYAEVLENTLGQTLDWEAIYDGYNTVYRVQLTSERSWYPTQIQITPAYDVIEYENTQEIVQRSLIIKSAVTSESYITFFPVKISMNGALTIESLNNYTGSSSDSSVYLEVIEYQPISGGSGSGGSGSGGSGGGIGLDLLN
jgi:uncharacterized protein (TIGR02145 family)